MIASNDNPATDKELDGFYGEPPTQAEINEVILRQKRAIDASDVTEISMDRYEEILISLECHDFLVGRIFLRERNKLIANRASIELFGKVGFIKPEDV